jgi:T-complex protein 1 subunit zeta
VSSGARSALSCARTSATAAPSRDATPRLTLLRPAPPRPPRLRPAPSPVARTATAQDDVTGDGTTSSVLFTGELLKYAERFISEGVHPRIIADGFELAQQRVLPFLESFKLARPGAAADRELLASVARTSLRTKLHPEMADHLTEIVTDAVLCVHKAGAAIDLNMIERMHMLHRTDKESRLVRGLVLDHGSRHPDMPTALENCFILIGNISLEYEKTEVTSTFTYSSAGERERMIEAERKFTDEKVRKVLELKRRVCTPENGKSFVIINQKGIDPFSLDLLAKEGIIALRRAKRRNMERLSLCCGGFMVNSADDLSEDCLGFAGKVYEQTLGDDKFTFVEVRECTARGRKCVCARARARARARVRT